MYRIFFFPLLIFLVFLNPVRVSAAVTWTETFPTGTAENRRWTSSAFSSDGSYIIVASKGTGGRVYISSNSGTSWTETFPTGVAEDKNWTSVASSSDGSHLIVSSIATNGRVYISSNGGTSWTETTPTGVGVDGYWYGVDSDSTGTYLIATGTTRLYISSNGGTSWTETMPGVDRNWMGINSSSDGSHLIAPIYWGRAYVSSNGGTSWTETFPTGVAQDKSWRWVDSDSTGNQLILATDDARVYISANGGTSWTETFPTGVVENQYWASVASDSTGAHLLAANDYGSGRVYLGVDSTLIPTPTPTLIPTPTPTSTSTDTGSSPNSGEEIYQIFESSNGNVSGEVLSPVKDSQTGNQKITAIIEPQTFSFNAFLFSQEKASADVFSSSTTQSFSNAILAGGSVLGITTAQGGIAWQIGGIQNIWYKAYAPRGSDKSPALIIPSLQNKPSIVSLSYMDTDLIPPGDRDHPFKPSSLSLAYSENGVTWIILPTSAVDPVNKTVSAIHKIGGYYMIVAGTIIPKAQFSVRGVFTTQAEPTPAIQPTSTPTLLNHIPTSPHLIKKHCFLWWCW